MTGASGKRTVETGYDLIAEEYLSTRDPEDPNTLAALEELSSGLEEGATVLDLGCGAGIPGTRWLSRRFSVTGVDVSARQLELARRHVPAARFLKADMTGLEFEARSFDAVVSLYAITHVPGAEQPGLVEDVFRWLRPGGRFLATWATGEWEGEEEDWEGWGTPMWWSNLDPDASLSMLRDAGFEIESAKALDNGDERWLWILAKKPSRRKEQ